MNKLKFIIICILSILVALILLESCLLLITNYKYQKFRNTLIKNKDKIEDTNFSVEIEQNKISNLFRLQYKNPFSINQENFRSPTIINSNKCSIILFGCSFAYGMYLSDKSTMQYLMSKYTQRSIYNYALVGASPRETLYLLRNLNFDNIENPEYIIYTYIPDHRKRLYEDTASIGPSFKISKDRQHLDYQEHSFCLLRRSYIFQTIQKIYANYKYKRQAKESAALLNLYFKEINNEIKKKFPYSKFIIFAYEVDGNENFKAIEEQDIIVIKAKDLIDIDITNEKYWIYKGNYHPNAEAWEIIVPQLVKELRDIT